MDGDGRLVDRLRADPERERAALVAGLRAPRAHVSPKYFYDAVGCALFAAICELPEYYPTRTERAIFHVHRDAIARAVGRATTLVDLGAGDGRKAAAWFDALGTRRYVAVDIARDALAATLATLRDDHPAVTATGIVADFTEGLDLDADLGAEPVTFFYPGSSIGNFAPAAARRFVAGIARHCAARPGSGLLIGVDTRKDPPRLVAAYDDAVGVTAAFNRNVLAHVNRAAPADFAPAAFVHRADYDAVAGRVSMHLEAAAPQVVHIDGQPRNFAAGERIHTEDSFKYAPDEFAALLEHAGFASIACWQDDAGDFAVFFAR
jgi:dimethylhistidine N-methyltransferase